MATRNDITQSRAPVLAGCVFSDEFNTPTSGPLASPHTSEPGIGTLALVQNDGQFSVAGGKLVVQGQATPVIGDLGLYGAFLARKAGRAVIMLFTRNGVAAGDLYPNMGWRDIVGLPTASAVPMSLNMVGTGSLQVNNANGVIMVAVTGTLSAGVPYQLSVVQRSFGGFAFIKGGTAFPRQTLLWIFSEDATANLEPFVNFYSASGLMDFLRLADLPDAFTSDYGIATTHVTTAVSGTDYSGNADGIYDLVITAPNPLANTGGLKFRKNGTSYWKVWGDSSGNLVLQRFVGDVGQGSPTTLSAGVWTAGATITIRVTCAGGNMDFSTKNGNTWTRRVSGQIADGFFTGQSGISPITDGSWVIGQLDAYPRMSSLYNALDEPGSPSAAGAAVAPATYFSDTFTGSDGTDLDGRTPTVGGNWASADGAGFYKINSNKANYQVSATINNCLADASHFDGTIKALGCVPRGSDCHILFRASDSTHFIYALWDGSLIRCRQNNGGSDTLIGSIALVGTPSSGYDMTIVLAGQTIAITVLGVTLSLTGITFNQTATKIGIQGANPGVGQGTGDVWDSLTMTS